MSPQAPTDTNTASAAPVAYNDVLNSRGKQFCLAAHPGDTSSLLKMLMKFLNENIRIICMSNESKFRFQNHIDWSFKTIKSYSNFKQVATRSTSRDERHGSTTYPSGASVTRVRLPGPHSRFWYILQHFYSFLSLKRVSFAIFLKFTVSFVEISKYVVGNELVNVLRERDELKSTIDHRINFNFKFSNSLNT